jgi:hypothetical protein
MVPASPPELDPEPPPLDEPLDDPLPPLDELVALHSQAPSCPLESHCACPVSAPWHEQTTVVFAAHETPAGCVLHPA